jgi:hypothetical protein
MMTLKGAVATCSSITAKGLRIGTAMRHSTPFELQVGLRTTARSPLEGLLHVSHSPPIPVLTLRVVPGQPLSSYAILERLYEALGDSTNT